MSSSRFAPVQTMACTLSWRIISASESPISAVDIAAAFLENRFRELKLQPAFGKSYKQPFEVKTGVEMGEGNRLGSVAADAWTPLGFSSSGRFSAPVVFVGYGIAAPPLGYDDYAGVDLQGKIALMLRYEPQEKDEKSIFDGRKPSRWS